jgi:hypothetical protein
MRTTIRIDDELLLKLKEQAARERVSLTRLVDRTLRAGMQAPRKRRRGNRLHREQSYPMGAPFVALDKALRLAARLEDEEIAREMTLRK